MIIGLDIDHTITDPFEIERYYATKYANEHNLPTEIVYPNKFGFLQKFGCAKADENKYWNEYGPEILKNCDVRYGAKEALQKLKDAGHTIVLISARGNSDMPQLNPYILTYNWLKKNEIPYDKLICRKAEKLETCKKMGIELFIDDNVKVAKNLAENGIETLLISAHHNVDDINALPNHCYFVNNYDEVLDCIAEITGDRFYKFDNEIKDKLNF